MKRLGILMIVVLLSYFTSLLRANDEIVPFTGECSKADTTEVTIPISIVKELNVKLTERLDLITLTKYQAIQIENYKKLTEINNSTIEYYRDNLIKVLDINTSLNKSIQDEIRKKNIWKYTAFSSIAVAIVSIITVSIIK